jgi:hypothetical protein
MRKVILCIAVLALLVAPLAAEAHPSRFVVQGPFFWHPFFYPGPFVYGYPGGFAYAYPGPYVSPASTGPYTYGYPGPYDYGTWTYAHPRCVAKPDGYWICS